MTYPSFRNLSFASSEEQNAFLTIKTPPFLGRRPSYCQNGFSILSVLPSTVN
nr:MAG TPA: hypothetical protein [Caudoviricetes sp.]